MSEIQATRPKGKVNSKTVNAGEKRTMRITSQYLEELEYFRRLLVEDIAPKHGSTAELRRQCRRCSKNVLRVVLRQVAVLQGMVKAGDVQSTRLVSNRRVVRRLFRFAPMHEYFLLLRLHNRYIEQISPSRVKKARPESIPLDELPSNPRKT
jgi:hypothetical protein